MRTHILTSAAAVILAASAVGPAISATEVLVYTAIEADQLKAYEAALEAAHPDVKVYVYDADHGFNSDRRNNYDKDAAELALKRTLELFEGA